MTFLAPSPAPTNILIAHSHPHLTPRQSHPGGSSKAQGLRLRILNVFTNHVYRPLPGVQHPPSLFNTKHQRWS